MAGSPRIIARPTTRSPAACRRARVRQGQAFGGAEEAPSLTAAARDGDGNMRSGRKNARGSGRTKEWNAKDDAKWRDAPLTKKAPYKPNGVFDPFGFEIFVDLGIGEAGVGAEINARKLAAIARQRPASRRLPCELAPKRAPIAMRRTPLRL